MRPLSRSLSLHCSLDPSGLSLYLPAEPKPFPRMTDKSSPQPRQTPSLPWKTRLFIFALSAVTDVVRRPDYTINRRLLNLLDRHAPASANPVAGVRTVDVTVDPSRDLWFRLFVPDAVPDGRRLPVIVFFHGGGFTYLSPATWAYDVVCRRISRKVNAAVASVSYRLSPEHRCPAPYDDGVDVLRFLDDSVEGVDFSDGLDLSSCFLAGDSAGANIAHHVARRWAAAEDWKRVNVRGIVSIQPFFGGEETTESEERLEGMPLVSKRRTEWMWRAFLPEGSDRDHEVAHVFGPKDRAELPERFPATAVVVGGYDPLKDRQRRYYEGLRARGKEARLVEYPDAIHAFYVFPELKESGQLIEVIRDFVHGKRGNGD